MILAKPQPYRCYYWLPKGCADNSNRPADVHG